MNSREFEHLSQALLLKTFGAAVQIFGDGADNGREAVYAGALKWATDDESLNWQGNTVFQAKFLQEPRDTTRDTAWFHKEVRDELKLWADEESTRRQKVGLPDNILFITNVTLSPGPNGGIDNTNSLMDEQANDIGINNIRTWHYDTLGRLLDGQYDIRRTFAGLITPGDVLTQLQRILDGQVIDVGETLVKHARRNIPHDQSIRLSDSGDPTQTRLQVNQIAIELPAQVSRKGGAGETGATELAIRMGDRCLKPSVLKTTTPRFNPMPHHLLLFGGPGQGKTTLSQLITTIYRVEFARTYGNDTKSQGLSETLDHIMNESITLPKNRRWPLRIDLAKFAEHASGGLETHLLKWVADELSSRSIFDIKAVELVSWLENWPSIIILDGYDEVIAPTAREAVANSVRDLIEDGQEHDMDLFIIITSRPQGYTDELRDLSFESAQLLELTTAQSLDYARRLAKLRHINDPAFADEVIERIKHAAQEPLTARLMTTPLQTTIMTMINETSVRAPQTRWELFNTYYDTIYRREANKSGSLATLLSQHRADVNDIHERAALQIQYQTEQTNQQDAVVSQDILRQMILDRLTSEGQSPLDAAALTEQIMQATTERLVLLIPQNQTDIGFEIRSLREYLAARSMASGEKEDILERMRAARDSAHWRNIWLLAAGRIFTERPELRQNLTTLLSEPYEDAAMQQLVPSGAQVALDLLVDGIGSQAPKFRSALLDQALTMLDYAIGIGDYAPKLATVLGQFAKADRAHRTQIIHKLQKYLRHNIEGAATAWIVIHHIEKDPHNPMQSSLNQLTPRAKSLRTELENEILQEWSRNGLPVAISLDMSTRQSLGSLSQHLSSTIFEAVDASTQNFFTAVELVKISHGHDALNVIENGDLAVHAILTTNLSDATLLQLAHVALDVEEADWCVRILIADQIQRTLQSRPVWNQVRATYRPTLPPTG